MDNTDVDHSALTWQDGNQNGDANQRCADLYNNKVYDESCSSSYNFICKKGGSTCAPSGKT